ncbi:hypothetical protein BH11BAC3_BH11BAC3_25220 [soil metagenome]
MKRLIFVLFSFPFIVCAQNNPLIVEGVSPALYLTHTVAPKENFYSVGRIYNISPKEIAPFNNLVMENGLNLNQVIKIPLSESNFLQEGNAAEDEVLIPLYHTVKEKEGLYRIGVNYNNVPAELIVKWNHLKSTSVPNGTKLIVGYLKVKKDLSTLASMATSKPADDIVKKIDEVEKPVAEKPQVVAVAKTPTPVVKQTEKVATEPVKKAPETVVTTAETAVKKVPASRKNFYGGVFKSDFEKQTQSSNIKAETGEAGTFKSTSGWEDGRYYCLHNTSTPGTIIKITNTSTGKNVYAKVLDVIPDMTQNNGLVIRLSNAAADELGAGDAKFNCTLSYSN